MALALLVAACGADELSLIDDPEAVEATYEYVVPAGAGEAYDRGEPLEILPAELEAIIMRCLRRDPEDRYRSAAELAEALARAAESFRPSEPLVEPSRPAPAVAAAEAVSGWPALDDDEEAPTARYEAESRVRTIAKTHQEPDPPELEEPDTDVDPVPGTDAAGV